MCVRTCACVRQCVCACVRVCPRGCVRCKPSKSASTIVGSITLRASARARAAAAAGPPSLGASPCAHPCVRARALLCMRTRVRASVGACIRGCACACVRECVHMCMCVRVSDVHVWCACVRACQLRVFVRQTCVCVTRARARTLGRLRLRWRVARSPRRGPPPARPRLRRHFGRRWEAQRRRAQRREVGEVGARATRRCWRANDCGAAHLLGRQCLCVCVCVRLCGRARASDVHVCACVFVCVHM